MEGRNGGKEVNDVMEGGREGGRGEGGMQKGGNGEKEEHRKI